MVAEVFRNNRSSKDDEKVEWGSRLRDNGDRIAASPVQGSRPKSREEIRFDVFWPVIVVDTRGQVCFEQLYGEKSVESNILEHKSGRTIEGELKDFLRLQVDLQGRFQRILREIRWERGRIVVKWKVRARKTERRI